MPDDRRRALLLDRDDGSSRPGLDLEIAARISASLDGMTGELRSQREERARLNEAIIPITIPTQQVTVVSGGVTIASAELLGPRNGIVWDVRRVTVVGLAASDVVGLYRVSSPVSASAVTENEITQITNQTTNAKDGLYSPGLGACLVRAGQSLMVFAASGLTATTITVNWDAISVETPWLGAYLL